MKITALERGKKTPRINVFVDDEFAFSVEEITLIKTGLYKGMEISSEQIEEITSKDLIEKFISRVIELLGRRPRSIFEIKQYLKRKLSDQKYNASTFKIEEVIEKIIVKLQEGNYLNDKDFALWWVKSRQEFKPKGKAGIQRELYQKGIDKEIIDEVLRELIDNDSQFKTALELGEHKFQRLKIRETDRFKLKSKLSAFLYSKGFDWDTIGKVLKELI